MWCFLFLISCINDVLFSSMTNPFLSTTEYFHECADLSHLYQEGRRNPPESFQGYSKPTLTVEDLTNRMEQSIATVDYVGNFDFPESERKHLFHFLATRCVCDLELHKTFASTKLRASVSRFLDFLGLGPIDLSSATLVEPSSSLETCSLFLIPPNPTIPESLEDKKKYKMPNENEKNNSCIL